MDSAVEAISITIAAVNDAPSATDLAVTTDEDVAVAVTLAGTDVDGDPLTFNVVSQPANGVLSGTAPNLTYTPNEDFNGTDTFTFLANDGQADSNVATVTIAVASVNDAPSGESQALETDEDVPVGVVLAGSDVDGDPLTFQVVDQPANGVLSGTAPTLTYTPNADYNGGDSFTYLVNDGTVDSAVETISVTIAAVNDAPSVTDLVVTTDEDVAVGVTLAGTDVDGDPLTLNVVTQPANGVLSGTAPNLTYTPNGDFNGTDTFTFLANDGQVDSNVATVTIAVASVNDAPEITSTPVTEVEVNVTNDVPQPALLDQWNAVNLSSNFTAVANWQVASDGLTVTQVVNADPSAYLSNFSDTGAATRIEGVWRVPSAPQPFLDDDFIGFVFRYQDSRHFMLFDWKQQTQSFSGLGTAPRGMRIKIVDSSRALSASDFWASDGVAVRDIYSNSIGWSYNRDYTFTLESEGNQFRIIVRDGSTVLLDHSFTDDTYASGTFGFYNHSQGFVEYEGFTQEQGGDTPYSYGVEATDADGDTLTYFLDEGPTGMTIDANTGEVSWVATDADEGPHTVTIRVTDPSGETTTQSYTLNVIVNRPPVIDAGPDRTLNLAIGNSLPLDGFVDPASVDPGATLTNTWTLEEGPAAGAVIASPSGLQTTVTFSQPGDYRFRLSVNDGLLTAVDETRIIVIDASNAPPVVDAGLDQSINLNVTNGVSLNGSIQDDGIPTAATSTWQLISGPGAVNFGDGGALQTTATFGATGTYVLALTATDTVFTISDFIEIQVTDASNVPPDVDPGPNQTLDLTVSDTITLDGAFTDDGLVSPATFTWSLVSGPASVSFSAPASLQTTAQFSAAGTYLLGLEVFDGQFTVTVGLYVQVIDGVNAPPVVDAGSNQTLNLATGSSVSVAGTVTDDGQPLAAPSTLWRLESGPAPVVFTSPNALQSSVEFTTEGSYVLALEANDGQFTVTNFMQVLVVNIANDPPVVDAGADQTLDLGVSDSASLVGTASDDGLISPLTFAWSLVSGPAPVLIVSPNALQTQVQFTLAGDYQFLLEASDGEHVVSDTVTVQVSGVANVPPTADAGVDQTILLGSTPSFTLTGTASDDGLPASGSLVTTWDLLAGVTGFEIVSPNELISEVNVTFPGLYTFQLTASDGASTVTDTVDVLVQAPPSVVWLNPTDGAGFQANTAFSLHAQAFDQDNGLQSVTFYQDGVALGQGTPDGSGQLFSFDLSAGVAAGSYSFYAEALDSDGLTSQTATVTLTVISGDPDAPISLAINNLTDSQEIGAPYDVEGLVQGSAVRDYQLRYRPAVASGPVAPWTAFATGFGEVNNGVLGAFDPTLLENGFYEIELSATNFAGSAYTIPPVMVLVDSEMKIGHYTIAFEDIALPVQGIPITVTRTYDSRDSSKGDFGAGWDLGTSAIRVVKNRQLGTSWQFENGPPINLGFLSLQTKCVIPGKRRLVSIVMPDNEVLAFEAELQVHPSEQSNYNIPSNCRPISNPQFVKMVFKPLGDTVGTLEPITPDVTVQAPVSGNPWGDNTLGAVVIQGSFLSKGFSPVYEPTQFRYTAPDGQVLIVSTDQGLEQIIDLNGNTVTITDSGITHSNGQSIGFTRNASNCITEIMDPDGNTLTYAYNAQGHLISFTDRTGAVTEFRYDNVSFPHYLTEIINAEGYSAIRTEFDEDGRMISQLDSNGNGVLFDHDIPNFTETITDRLGNATVHEYDQSGNVIKTTDPLGNVTTYTHDGNDNEISMTDALGNTWQKTYDANKNVTSETDPLGNTSSVVFGAEDRPESSTDKNGNTINYAYDGAGNITSITDPNGAVTIFAYDAFGDISTLTDAEGNITTMTYNGNGYQTSDSTTDSNGTVLRTVNYVNDSRGNQLSMEVTRTLNDGSSETQTTQFEYDGEDRLTRVTAPDGGITRIVHDGLGREIQAIDALGRVTETTYDGNGNVIHVSYPDGSSESATYNAKDQRLTSTDRLGKVTTFTYDALGRLLTITHPDGAVETNSYDGIGQLVATTDALGNVTMYEFDAAKRRTKVIDPLLQESVTTYDAKGRVMSFTDPRGFTTSYTYDNADRQISKTFPDGTFVSQTFDNLGRRLTSTDQEGNVTQYEYDGSGRLLTGN